MSKNNQNNNKPLAEQIIPELTPYEKHVVEETGLEPSAVKSLVKESDKIAKIKEIKGKLEKTRDELKKERGKEKLNLAYFFSGNKDALKGKISEEKGFDFEDFIIELSLFAQESGFMVSSAKSILFRCGIGAYLMLSDAFASKFLVDLDNMAVAEPFEFVIVKNRAGI